MDKYSADFQSASVVLDGVSSGLLKRCISQVKNTVLLKTHDGWF